ncbi:MAG: DUF2330 domain-containing protein [Polyangiaceae bacterium]
MLRKSLALLLPLLAVTASNVRDAAACGGCFVPPDANTQVTGHRMVLSVSSAESTLWDQITYDGDPASFAWVLPIRGQVDVGVSSDLLFNSLAFMTDTVIVQPSLNCPYSCSDYGDGGENGPSGAASGTGGGSAGGVTVIAQEVVGPYDTAQVAADDPQALQDWLDTNGYNIPDEIAPIIADYVEEGFGFLALKLVPGQGIDSMKPVRITTPGGSAQLPLRMVAAGTGAITPITLWVVGEGRYEPSNFSSFSIPTSDIVWNWDTSDSNYAALKEQGLAADGGATWLVESATAQSPYAVENLIQPVIDNLPEQSGYGDPDGLHVQEQADEDLAALYGALDRGAMWITRMHAQLPRAALDADLNIGASADQTTVPNLHVVTETTGTVPLCPPDPCASGSSGSGPFLPDSDGFEDGGSEIGGGGCNLGHGGTSGLGAMALALVLAWSRRRRAR